MAEETETSGGGLEVEPIVFGGLLLVLLMILVVVGSQAWLYDLQQEEAATAAPEQWAEKPPHKSRWVNQDEGKVQLGIGRAMQAVAARQDEKSK